jgi:hypothetical protein
MKRLFGPRSLACCGQKYQMVQIEIKTEIFGVEEKPKTISHNRPYWINQNAGNPKL